MSVQFSKESLRFTKKNTKAFLKKHGIFFTPKSHRDELFEHISPFIQEDSRVLEPSAGSGEFVNDLIRTYNGLHIDAIELNEELFNHLDTITGCHAIHADFISRQFTDKYDIILGNPPYFELKKTSKYYNTYKAWWKGRMNMYSLFILKSVALLKQGGVLAFVVPPSWMNGKYYECVRSSLSQQGTMLYMSDFSHINTFMKTQQDTMLFVFQKGNGTVDKYKLQIKNKIFYCFKKEEIQNLIHNTTTIK